uniref:Membrane progestin receptor beta n=1 Tax=Bostrychus sinensis TaxID=86224 RepID=A0A141GIG8_9TELE|nr:membrane progestin receptor beta [Bostrychus sinensis]
MPGDILQRLTTLTLSVKQLGRLPNLVQRLPSSLPSPSPTVGASHVPSLFREPHILTGYRPLRQKWYCYLLSLFQKHNESLNVWTHLLAAPVLLLRWWSNVGTLGYTLDISSLPLCLFLLSAIFCYFCSTVAHLFQSHSEQAHYYFFFMDYVGVAVYQYGCALGHYFYTSTSGWRASIIGYHFLHGTAIFGLLSSTGCCLAKSRYRKPYPVQRKICQLIPTSLAYFLGISPVVDRLLTGSWTEEPSLNFHVLQIVFFLSSALFFSCPIPECFFPGKFDIFGHGHQIFHVLLSLTTLSQLEALFQDYARKRDQVIDIFGETQIWWACVSFPILVFSCLLVAFTSMKYMHKKLKQN